MQMRMQSLPTQILIILKLYTISKQTHAQIDPFSALFHSLGTKQWRMKWSTDTIDASLALYTVRSERRTRETIKCRLHVDLFSCLSFLTIFTNLVWTRRMRGMDRFYSLLLLHSTFTKIDRMKWNKEKGMHEQLPCILSMPTYDTNGHTHNSI